MKNLLVVCIAFAVGIAFGYLLFRPSFVRAQGGVIVTEAVQTQGRIPNPVSGTVVGFFLCEFKRRKSNLLHRYPMKINLAATPRKLDGARLKLKRAKEHIDGLHFLVRQFCETGVHLITVERDAETSHEALKIAPAKTVPPDFSLILGDAVRNLACALDLAWFELTAADSPPKSKINFPIYPGRPHLEEFLGKRKEQASVVAVSRKLLDEIQPYNGENGDAIYSIHHLDIADKHRLLIPQVQIGRD